MSAMVAHERYTNEDQGGSANDPAMGGRDRLGTRVPALPGVPPPLSMPEVLKT